MQTQIDCWHFVYLYECLYKNIDKVYGSVDNEMINKSGNVIGSQRRKILGDHDDRYYNKIKSLMVMLNKIFCFRYGHSEMYVVDATGVLTAVTVFGFHLKNC